MSNIIPIRGVVYRADLGFGLKPWLVVSNNTRNQKLDSCLVARLTTTQKPEMVTTVPLSPADAPLVGFVCCDDIMWAGQEELKEKLGALSGRTMMKVADGLKAAFALL